MCSMISTKAGIVWLALSIIVVKLVKLKFPINFYPKQLICILCSAMLLDLDKLLVKWYLSRFALNWLLENHLNNLHGTDRICGRLSRYIWCVTNLITGSVVLSTIVNQSDTDILKTRGTRTEPCNALPIRETIERPEQISQQNSMCDHVIHLINMCEYVIHLINICEHIIHHTSMCEHAIHLTNVWARYTSH